MATGAPEPLPLTYHITECTGMGGVGVENEVRTGSTSVVGLASWDLCRFENVCQRLDSKFQVHFFINLIKIVERLERGLEDKPENEMKRVGGV